MVQIAMTPQSAFMVAAPVRPSHEAALCALLASMNRAPGRVDPNNKLFPFACFDQLHVARFVILRDETIDDLTAYGTSFPDAPVWLAFLGDCDGAVDSMLHQFVAVAEPGLRQIFGCCDDPPGPELLAWMRRHSVQPAAQYINWLGRTVRQIREEAALHTFLRDYVVRNPILATQPPVVVRDQLVAQARGRPDLVLTPPAPTPSAWRRARLWWLASTVLLAVLVTPILLILSPLLLFQLRVRERTDPVITPRPTVSHIAATSRLEDYDVTNPFSAFGSVKPGLFRLWTLLLVFRALEFSTRFIYTRGRLARVGTIHFARWVFMDDGRRLLFASNYDSSLDSYMDDFINKVAFGLNLVFSNGIGWPRTSWLICGGAKYEQEFKNFLHRHEVPTQVWYKAYPGLTASDLATNTQIREGLQRDRMTEVEARRWLALI
jgi:hypothetical protein